MVTQVSKWKVVFTGALFGAVLPLFASSAIASTCSSLFAATQLELTKLDSHLLPMIREYQIIESTGQLSQGVVASYPIYYVQQPSRETSVPGVFVDTKAIVIAFGGAGTHTSTGATWKKMSHSLAKYDVEVIGFDYPFHGKGPTTEDNLDFKTYFRQLDRFIRTYESTGLPLYFVGHSYGPALIQELLFHSPNIARGAIMLGPGADMSDRHTQWYDSFMERLFSPGYDGEMRILLKSNVGNKEGENWNRTIGKQMKSRNRDQTTNAPVRIFVGRHDEWSTPEILEEIISRFPDARMEVLEGVNHVNILELPGAKELFVAEKILEMIRATSSLTLDTTHSLFLDAGSRIDYLNRESALFRSMLAELKQPMLSHRKNDRREALLLERWTTFVRNAVHSQARAMARLKPETVSPSIREILVREASEATQNEIQKLTNYIHVASGGEAE